jgi:hypothetical protein
MKEPFSGYLAKLVGKKEDCVTHLSPERALTPKKIANDSSESHGRTQQAKGCDRASKRAGKTKKYHMPFVALALRTCEKLIVPGFPRTIQFKRDN